MALKTTVKVGGLSGSTLVNYTSQVPLWDLSERGEHQSVFDAGMQCNNGSACQYQFVVDDDPGEIPKADLTKNLASHNQVTVSEDGPGYEAWLSRGRIADKSVGRGDVEYGSARGFSVTVDDANTDTRGLALTTAWVRGSESGRARILALAAAFLNGSPRLTTVVSTHLVAAGGEVTMPAKTYPAGTDLNEIIGDCATTEGKVWSLVIHHLASVSHLCLLYIDEADHTTYASTLSITDTSPNLTTSFPPIWDQGAATLESGGDNPISGLVSRYGSGDDLFVYRTQSGITDAYDYWVVPYNDSLSQTSGQATSRADAILNSRRTEHVTHQVTIQIPATKVDLLCAGMSITIRSAAAMGGQYLNTTQTRRIGQLKWQLIAPDVGAVDGHYLAHMQLDRPSKVLPEKIGLPVGPNFQPPLDDPTVPGSSAPVIANWTWSNGPLTGGFLNYDQAVDAYPAIPQSAGTMSNGTNNGAASFRSQTAGQYIPLLGAADAYLPCTAGTDISLACDVAPRGSSSGTRKVEVQYRTAAGGSTVGANVVVHNDTGTGYIHATATLTPPATATVWRIFILGNIDNVVATTGSDTPATNPYNGTESCSARCDHTHDPAAHNHDLDYSELIHLHALEDVADVDLNPAPNDNDILVYDAPTLTWKPEAPGAGADVLAKVSANDTTAGYLNGKLVAGTNVTFTENTDGGNETLTIASSGGAAGASWTQNVNESGASFANFTSVSGTWASTGTIIQQTGTPSAATKQARYSTIQPFGFGTIVEAEMRFPTTGQGTGANVQAKLVIGDTSTGGGGGLAVVVDRGANNMQLERYGVILLRNFTATVNLDTWYKIRMVQVGRWASVYRDGVLLGTGRVEVSQETADYFLLSTYNSLVDFRNIKLWVLSGGAPA